MKADPHSELTRQYEPQRERCKPLTCTGNERCWVKRGGAALNPACGVFFICCSGPPAVSREYAGPHNTGRIAR